MLAQMTCLRRVSSIWSCVGSKDVQIASVLYNTSAEIAKATGVYLRINIIAKIKSKKIVGYYDLDIIETLNDKVMITINLVNKNGRK